MSDELERLPDFEALEALAIGSVILSGHHVVWQRKFGGWYSTTGEIAQPADYVWGREARRPRDRRYRVLLRKPGPPASEQEAWVLTLHGGFSVEPDAAEHG